MDLRYNFKSVIELINAFDTEQTCIDYLEKLHWNDKVISPYDTDLQVFQC